MEEAACCKGTAAVEREFEEVRRVDKPELFFEVVAEAIVEEEVERGGK